MNLPKTDIAPSLLVLFGSAAGLAFTNNIDTSESGAGITFGPYFYPSLILWILLMLSTALLAKSVSHSKKNMNSESSEKKEIANSKIILLFLTLLIYSILFFNFGFLYSSILALFSLQIIFGRKKNLTTITISIVTPTVLYFLFTYLFDIALP